LGSARARVGSTDRRGAIVDAAARYFAAAGFGADTRALARQLGVTQPLLYRYFASKDELIEAVFEQVYLRRVDPGLAALFRDRSRPIRARLIEFTQRYSAGTFRAEWIRLYTFAGLRGGAFNRRYIRGVTEPLLRALCAEILVALGRAARVTERHLALAWIWHGGLYYAAIRRHVYGLRAPRLERTIEDSVDMLLAGFDAITVTSRVSRAASPSASPATARRAQAHPSTPG
jgi:AcrR family transcriptional regulator